MSGNKQYVKTGAQPPSHVAVAKTCSGAGNKLRHIAHTRHTPSRHNAVRPSPLQMSYFRHFPTSLAPLFSNTRGSLNFLSVHSFSQKFPLISCVSAQKFQRRLTLLGLISITGVKHLPALLAKKFHRRPPIVVVRRELQYTFPHSRLFIDMPSRLFFSTAFLHFYCYSRIQSKTIKL